MLFPPTTVVAWFPVPAEGYILRLRRLNQGLDTRHWRVYKRRESPTGSALCSALMQPVTVLEKL
jgi:hypothetical protein